ncbi:MAG TPA: insulinase family protein [Thermoanaerobaculia bacterium]|nr:insulinase family protein [Thermoanaerobaculia bacterium]
MRKQRDDECLPQDGAVAQERHRRPHRPGKNDARADADAEGPLLRSEQFRAALSGDVHPAEAYALAEELFGEWKATEDPHKLHPVPPHPPLQRSATIAVIQRVKTATVQIAWHGPSMTGDVPATFAADVLSFILSQPNSRFHRNLVDSGLFDFATVSYFSQVHTGPMTPSARPRRSVSTRPTRRC